MRTTRSHQVYVLLSSPDDNPGLNSLMSCEHLKKKEFCKYPESVMVSLTRLKRAEFIFKNLITDLSFLRMNCSIKG